MPSRNQINIYNQKLSPASKEPTQSEAEVKNLMQNQFSNFNLNNQKPFVYYSTSSLKRKKEKSIHEEVDFWKEVQKRENEKNDKEKTISNFEEKLSSFEKPSLNSQRGDKFKKIQAASLIKKRKKNKFNFLDSSLNSLIQIVVMICNLLISFQIFSQLKDL
ncbi:MAG: hypothetical protein SFU25_07895 [Candidatus Caenarcaniphilales bacterium]|nr:hypothetical protein [Candidatus Caenarcaniphilales bacterium]